MMPRVLVFSLAAALAACNPYNPDLGATPFRCGTSEPRCPDGYGAVDVPPPVLCECRKGEEDTSDGGSGADSSMFFMCDDPDEGGTHNEDTATATMTSIGAVQSSYMAPDQSICPQGDVDVFRMSLTTAGKMIVATVTFDTSHGMLQLDILNSAGMMLATGTLTGNQLRAIYQVPSAGTYYFRVKAGAGTRNNYAANVTITN